MPTPKPVGLFGIKGRWSTNSPYACPEDQVIEALNVDWYRSTLCRKRGGAANVSLAGGTAQTGVTSFLFSHLPGYDQAARELWSIDDAATPRFKRLAAGVNWADVTLVDNVATRPMEANACSFNGKLFFFYDSTVNRAHCWDPADAKVRRVGLATPAAATVANTGASTYSATIRYYKVAYAVMSGTTILRRSNLSPVVSFTPSGAGLAARVTKPATISEDETHWLLYGSPDNSNFVLLATTVVGTTTYDDTTLPGSYVGTAAPDPNAFTPLPSARFAVADGTQMVMAGAWETAAGDAMVPSVRRVWWTSPLGATDQGDDERVSNTSVIKSYTDFDEAVTGLSSPQQGSIYVFSYTAMWKLVSTGVASAPYNWLRVTGGKGCVDHKTIVSAQDENGNPCTYWLSPQGPCRMGVGGSFSLVEDVADLWDTVNLGATSVFGHGVYHRDKHQVWWWISTGVSNDPDTKIVFDVDLGRIVEAGKVRRGWSKHDGNSAAARCSTMHSNTIAASMSRDLKPYIGRSTGTLVWKCDTGTDDAGTNFQAYIKSRPITPAGLGVKFGLLQEAVLSALVGAGVTITLTINKDTDAELFTSTVLLTASGTESRVTPTFEDSKLADAQVAQLQIGDGAAVSNGWNLDALSIPVTDHGPN